MIQHESCLHFGRGHESGATLLGDVTTKSPRPSVHICWRQWVFNAVHCLSHPGVTFVWPYVHGDVCQHVKLQWQTKAALQFLIPQGMFEHVHMDLLNPVLPSKALSAS